MENKQFYVRLALLSVIVAGLLLAQRWVPDLYEHQLINWVFLLFFIVFTILTYFAAQRAAKSPNLNTYTSVILGAIFGKLFFTIIILITYNELMAPSSNLFILPFFLIYFLFTIFELQFLIKLGKLKNK